MLTPIVGNIFPNFSFLRSSARTFRVWQPRGPGKIELWSWVYTDKAAPDHVKKAIRLAAIRANSPSGTFEQDDVEIWQDCTHMARGVVSQRHHLNMQMGLGHDSFDQELGGRVSHARISEMNQRSFYARWNELMRVED